MSIINFRRDFLEFFSLHLYRCDFINFQRKVKGLALVTTTISGTAGSTFFLPSLFLSDSCCSALSPVQSQFACLPARSLEYPTFQVVLNSVSLNYLVHMSLLQRIWRRSRWRARISQIRSTCGLLALFFGNCCPSRLSWHSQAVQ